MPCRLLASCLLKLLANNRAECHRPEVPAITRIKSVIAHHEKVVGWDLQRYVRGLMLWRLAKRNLKYGFTGALAKNHNTSLFTDPFARHRLTINCERLTRCDNGI